jgi:hypothetical protein
MAIEETAEPKTATAAGEVFVSYSWDSPEHIRTVLELSNRLRSDGIDCVLDQYEVSPPEGWPRWMDRKIRDAQFVLSVCTEIYQKRVMGDEDAGKGLGVQWEGGLIYQHLYNAGAANTKFIPILLRADDQRFIPTPLQSATRYQIDTDEGYKRLYARLLGLLAAEKPPLGKSRAQKKKEVKTELTMYVTGPIEVELWNEAKWLATFFMLSPGLPPILGLGFLNKEPARKIFEKWHLRYGRRDEFEELRVSIVEGDIKGEDPGYTVHIGVDPDNTLKRYREAGLKTTNDSLMMMVSRLNRMHPSAESKNLQNFKREFRRSKTYLLIPGTCREDGSQLSPIIELGILKNSVLFRRVEEIGENDLDSVAVHSGEVQRPFTDFGLKRKRDTTS